MSVIVNPRIVTDGLILDVDAASPASLSNLNRNLLTNTESYDNGIWFKGSTEIFANQAVAPDGSFTADFFREQAVSAYHQIGQQFASIPSTTYTYSFYAKYVNRTFLVASFNGSAVTGTQVYCYFNLTNGTLGSNNGTTNPTITSVGNGWYRIQLSTTTLAVAGTSYVYMTTSQDSGNTLYTGDTSYGYYLWGSQVEYGTTASTYAPVSSNILSTKWTNISSGTNYTTTPNLSQVQVLVVGGGGGGGGDIGAGGGGGGLIYNPAFPVSSGTAYTVTVGAGGTAIPFPGVGQVQGINGGNSVFGSLTAIGGGGGAVFHQNGNTGGSGGGGSAEGGIGLGTAGQGYNGGAGGGTSTDYIAGGGGGIGGPGSPGILSSGRGGAGGPGLTYDISGVPTDYAGGGGGGGINGGGSASHGGAPGYARPGDGSQRGFDATPYTGGGGGGTGSYGGGTRGGSGIVIARYPKPIRATGGTITAVGNDIVHTFTASGTFTVLNSDIQLLNNPTYQSTSSGVISFNGSTQYAPIPTTGLPYGASPSTMEVWVNCNTVTTTSSYLFALSYGTAASNQGRHIGLLNDRFIYGSFGAGDFYSSAGILPNTWYHAVGTYDGSTQLLYVNGELVATGTSQILATTESTAQIGRQVNASQYWPGQIAKAAIYNRALSATEIKQNFNALRGRFGI